MDNHLILTNSNITESTLRQNHIKNMLADKKIYQYMENSLNESLCTDVVNFEDFSEFYNFATYWNNGSDDATTEVPADILKSGTIPIKDIKIVWKTSNNDLYTARVLVTDGSELYLNKEHLQVRLIANMYVESASRNNTFDSYIPVSISYNENRKMYVTKLIPAVGVSVRDRNNVKLDPHFTEENVNVLISLFAGVLKTWYGIQLALLHPITKEIFLNPKSEKRDRKELLEYRGDSKHKSKYVKVHKITSTNCINSSIDKRLDELNKSSETSNKKKYTRKTLLWRVIGHNHTTRNGEVKWVDPYWKGPLRDFPNKDILKENDREVILKDNIVDDLN